MNSKEISNSIIKSVFAAIPFAGQPLNELFFDYRGRIKQNRINEFSKLLSDYFASKTDIEFQDLNYVEFSDLFESVILRVANTGSAARHKRFRDILVNYIEQPNQTLDHTGTFLELVAVLTEPAIMILKYHAEYDQQFAELEGRDRHLQQSLVRAEDSMNKEKITKEEGYANEYSKYSFEVSILKLDLQNVQDRIKNISKYREAEFYNLNGDDFLYLKQILQSRALMTDSGIGSIGHIPYKYMRITTFGKHFINYIKETKND